jgi:tetratricopeptide (TPR) repeat protein
MSQITSKRYPGLRPFQDSEIDRLLFKGRAKESKKLLHLILSEKLVVMFAKSGMGKTSMLNAGIFNLLREQGFFPIPIRLNDPERKILDIIFEEIHTIASSTSVEVKRGALDGLWQYFKETEFWSTDDRLLTPVLVFDQFEEIFTLYSDENRKPFLGELADLMRNTIPKAIREGLPEKAQRFTASSPELRIVISIREDFLANLEEFAHAIPNILQTRFRMTALSLQQAKEAIEEPALLIHEDLATRRFTYTAEALKAILNFLSKQTKEEKTIESKGIEPFQLQLICDDVERRIFSRQARTSKDENIIVTEKELGGESGMQNILQGFYDRQIHQFHPARRRRVRKLCEKGLISATGRRLSLDEEMIGSDYKVNSEVLLEMINYRLLRAEPRLGSTYYELCHDTLVTPIEKSYKRRLSRNRRITSFGIFLILLIAWFTVIWPNLKPKVPELEFQRAEKLINEGQFSKAINKFKDAGESGIPKAYFRLAQLWEKIQIYDRAIFNYYKGINLYHQKSIAPNETNLQIYKDLNLGYISSSRSRLSTTNKSYKSEIAPNVELEKYRKSSQSNLESKKDLIASQEKQLPKATKPIRKGQETFEDLFEFDFEDDSKNQIKQDQHKEIVKLYRNITKKNPNQAYLVFHLLTNRIYQCYGWEAQNEDKCSDIYDIALRIKTNNPFYFLCIGEDFKDGYRYDLAIKSHMKALGLIKEKTSSLSFIHTNIGALLIDYEKPKEAIKHLDKAFQFSPDNPNTFRELTRAYIKVNDLEKAILTYTQGIKKDKDIAYLWENLVSKLSSVNKNLEADRIYKIALKVDLNDSYYYDNLGDSLFGVNKNEMAKQSYLRAISLDPGNSEILSSLGFIMLRQKNFKEAVDTFKKSVDYSEDPLGPRLGLVLAYIANGESEEALREFEKAVEEDSEVIINAIDYIAYGNLSDDYITEFSKIALEFDADDPWYYNELGSQLSNLKKYELANTSYKKGIDRYPNNGMLYSGSAWVNFKQKRYKESIEKFRKSVKFSKDPIEPRLGLALAYIANGDSDDALTEFEKAVEENSELIVDKIDNIEYSNLSDDNINKFYQIAVDVGSKKVDYYLKLGDYFTGKERFVFAEKAFNRAGSVDPKNEKAFSEAGWALYNQKSYKSAIDKLDKAISLNPKNPSNYNIKAIVLDEIYKYDDAISSYKAAIALAPDNAIYYSNIADLLHTLGRYKEAIENYSQAIRIRKSAELYSDRGYVYWDQGRLRMALEDFERAINTAPDYADAYNGRGVVFGDRQQKNKAIEEFTKAIELDSKGMYYNNRGIAYLELGRYDLAEKDLNENLKLKSSDPFAYKNLGILKLYQKEYKGAVKISKEGFERSQLPIDKFANRLIQCVGESKISTLLPDCKNELIEMFKNVGNKGRLKFTLETTGNIIEANDFSDKTKKYFEEIIEQCREMIEKIRKSE